MLTMAVLTLLTWGLWTPDLPRAELAAPRLAELLTLDDPGFRKLFSGSILGDSRPCSSRFIMQTPVGWVIKVQPNTRVNIVSM